jgi:hypothetical protein
MLIRAILIAAVLFWLWTRSPMFRRGGWRMFAGLFAVLLVVAGIAFSIKGEPFVGVPMIVMSLFSALGGRARLTQMFWSRVMPGAGGASTAAGAAPPPRPEPSGMSAADARSILGVGPEATVEDIRAAYSRLMQRAHPDKGGSAGLAAQLNAARDRLLKA